MLQAHVSPGNGGLTNQDLPAGRQDAPRNCAQHQDSTGAGSEGSQTGQG